MTILLNKKYTQLSVKKSECQILLVYFIELLERICASTVSLFVAGETYFQSVVVDGKQEYHVPLNIAVNNIELFAIISFSLIDVVFIFLPYFQLINLSTK